MYKNERDVLVLSGNGTIKVQKDTIPEVTKGYVKIKVLCSLVSPGTELKGWDALAKQRTCPNLLPKPKKFGYSLSGVVEEVGEDVDRFSIGQRIAAIGAGFAIHSNYAVVPQNLCIELENEVSNEEGAYSMLLATALQAVRRADPSIGEYYAVSGLGIVGLLSAKLLQLSGCKVCGIDQHTERLEIAKKLGIKNTFLASDENINEKIQAFTNQEGLDGAVVAFGGQAQSAMDLLVNNTKLSPDLHHEGVIVTVGWPEFDYFGEIGKMNNIDLRRSSRTGCGYHDAEWEISKKDYPSVFVRWTTQRNLRLCLELVKNKEIDVNLLTTHKIKLVDAEKEIAALLDNSNKMLGVIFYN
ncbi:MAG: zinc-dependent alcohol dehydrogenase [Pleomorphochaeta sp.]